MMAEVLSSLGAALTLLLGVWAIAMPTTAARVVGLSANNASGIAEIRATQGGFFAALGGLCLYLQEPLVYQVLGIAWLMAAAARTLSAAVSLTVSPMILGGIAVEAGVGLLCLANFGFDGM